MHTNKTSAFRRGVSSRRDRRVGTTKRRRRRLLSPPPKKLNHQACLGRFLEYGLHTRHILDKRKNDSCQEEETILVFLKNSGVLSTLPNPCFNTNNKKERKNVLLLLLLIRRMLLFFFFFLFVGGGGGGWGA